MSDKRMLGFVWLAMSLILLAVVRDLSAWGFAELGVANARFADQMLSASDLGSFLLVAVASVVLWKHVRVHQFCLEVVEETRKVVWPTRRETQDHSFVVVTVSIVLALMLWGFDLVWKRLFGVILNVGA